MTMDEYKTAVELRTKIDHIINVADFLEENFKNEADKATIRECGFIAHPKDIVINKSDIDVIITALYNERLRLIEEFQRI